MKISDIIQVVIYSVAGIGVILIIIGAILKKNGKKNRSSDEEGKKMFYISYFAGGTDDGFIAYDNTPCHSIDMAMTFDTKEEAEEKKEELQKEWIGSTLQVCEFNMDDA